MINITCPRLGNKDSKALAIWIAFSCDTKISNETRWEDDYKVHEPIQPEILSEESLFSVNFEQLVMKRHNDRNVKEFRSKTQLVAMIFSTLAIAGLLREILS